METVIVQHKGESRIALYFENSVELNARIRKLDGVRWSVSLKAWHVPNTEANRKLFKLPGLTTALPEVQVQVIPDKRVISHSKMHDLAVAAYTETLRLKNYSINTIKNYVNYFILFLIYFKDTKPSCITKAQVMDYLVVQRRKPNWSSTSQNQNINAIKFFYEKVLKRAREEYDLPRAKKEYKLPPVFAESEIKQILDVTKNLKHLSMLCLSLRPLL